MIILTPACFSKDNVSLRLERVVPPPAPLVITFELARPVWTPPPPPPPNQKILDPLPCKHNQVVKQA